MGSPQSERVEWTFRSAVGGISESRFPLKIREIRDSDNQQPITDN